MKVLILRQKSEDYFLKYLKDSNWYDIYKENINYKNIIFRISYRFNLKTLNFFFGNWKKKLYNADKVIIFDNIYNKKIAEYIKNKNKNTKIILYYWNKIDDSNMNLLNDKNINECYTFNKEDSYKYNIKLNPQFYSKKIILENKYSINSVDVIFLGMAKRRKNEILRIKNILGDNKIKIDFIIIEDQKDFISYPKYLEKLNSTKAILDIGNTNESGLTVRAMESIFLNKKLITNYKNIKSYDFYNPKNIFILDEDDINNIKMFIETPYEKIDIEIINKYDYKSWLKRFKT